MSRSPQAAIPVKVGCKQEKKENPKFFGNHLMSPLVPSTNEIFVRVVVAKSEAIIYTSIVFGWIYFVAWSVSFYPQIWINYRRKSVEGLNFDFLTLNIVGFTLYSLFNCGLYFIKDLQDEYEDRYPHGVNPVMLNDVVFSLHAMFATCITIAQCFMYEVTFSRLYYRARLSILSFF